MTDFLITLSEDRPVDLAECQAKLQQHVRFPHQRTVVRYREGYDAEAVLDLVAAHYEQCRIGRTTVVERMEQQARNFLHTLRRQPPWATTLTAPLRGMHAFIVSAGPSLDKNGHLLARAQELGPIIAVNTAARACLRHGVTPDIVLCAEMNDDRATFDGLPRDVIKILDARASLANWSACQSGWAICNQEPSLLPTLMELGVPPISYEGSVACAAISLAISWGATPVLIGQDLAYTDGRGYAAGTPYEDLRFEVREGVVWQSAGTSKAVKPQPAVMVPGWAEREVVSTPALVGFRQWIERAARHPIVNCTEGGAHIRGIAHHTLDQLLAGKTRRRWFGWDTVETPHWGSTVDVLRRLSDEAERVLRDKDAWIPAPEHQLFNCWTVPVFLQTVGMPYAERRDRMREAMVAAATATLEILA